jgi:hypothetical protein
VLSISIIHVQMSMNIDDGNEQIIEAPLFLVVLLCEGLAKQKRR